MLAPAAHAADAVNFPAERARLAAQRQHTEAVFAAKNRECQTQFVVTSCVEDAKKERRETMDRIGREQVVLDDAMRKQRAADRIELLQQKQKDAASRIATPPRIVERKPSAAASGAVHAASAPHSMAPTPAQQAENEAAFEKRQEQAEAHREAVAKRNAERAATKKPGSALPLPAPAPASAAH